MSREVRTRFAPSPTGYLHIGGVRTALYNWLFARRHGGKFILRIDDTDQQRNVAEALQPILHGLRWLGLEWDEGPEVGGPCGPYFQSQRSGRHSEAVRQLLASGHAYRDFATAEEYQAERDAAISAKVSFLYSRRFMAESDGDAQRFESEGRQAVVRLKMPRSGEVVVEDLVRGDVTFRWEQEADHVVQRADGSCIYHLASVVDDQDFGISHVIRAEEHLSNTPRQIFIAQSLGYPLPAYAHLPCVAEPGSKTKLSKRKLDKYLKNPEFLKLHRHGEQVAAALKLNVSSETFNPVIVDFYEYVGYLPHALINYLLLLGWSLDGSSEFFDLESMIRLFDLGNVSKSAASFDPQKLLAFEDHLMREADPALKRDMMKSMLERAGYTRSVGETDFDTTLARVIDICGDRLKTAGDILLVAPFFFGDTRIDDDKALQKRLGSDEARGLLGRFAKRLEGAEEWSCAALEALLQGFLETEGVGHGSIVHGLRLCVTGQSTGPGLYETMEILGQKCCLQRIAAGLKVAENRTSTGQTNLSQA